MASVNSNSTQQESYDYLFKLLVNGDQQTGKSCLIKRFVNGGFSEKYVPTIGIDFVVKTVTLDGKTVKLQMWDTDGQERAKAITSSYYRGAHGVIMLFDLADRKTFANIEDWLTTTRTQLTDSCAYILVGNKADHPDRVVSNDEAEALAEKHGIDYVETSAKDNSNVNIPFMQVTKKIMQSKDTGVSWWKK